MCSHTHTHARTHPCIGRVRTQSLMPYLRVRKHSHIHWPYERFRTHLCIGHVRTGAPTLIAVRLRACQHATHPHPHANVRRSTQRHTLTNTPRSNSPWARSSRSTSSAAPRILATSPLAVPSWTTSCRSQLSAAQPAAPTTALAMRRRDVARVGQA